MSKSAFTHHRYDYLILIFELAVVDGKPLVDNSGLPGCLCMSWSHLVSAVTGLEP